MLNLDRIAAYLAVLESGGFHEAARHLGLSQASVSQQVRKLEQELGTQLIVRDRTGCRPAPGTREFARYARAMASLSERALRAFDRPIVAVGAASNIGVYFLPPLHRRFVDRYGDTAELRPTLGHNRAIAELLADDAIDLALMEWWDDRPGFEARTWRQDELVVIVGPDHPWRSRRTVRLAELAEQTVLGGEPYSGTGTLLRRRVPGVPLRVAMNLGSTEAVKQAVRNGLGVSLVLAGTVDDEVRSGELHALRIADAPVHKDLFVIHRPNLGTESPVSGFVEMIRAASAPASTIARR